MLRGATISLVVLIACGGKQSSPGPAWPESAGTVIPDDYKDDGGESLEPKVPATAAVEASTKAEPAKKPDDKPDDKKPDDGKKPDDKKPDDKKPEKPSETTPTPPVLEEIVIEIND